MNRNHTLTKVVLITRMKLIIVGNKTVKKIKLTAISYLRKRQTAPSSQFLARSFMVKHILYEKQSVKVTVDM